MAKTCEVGTLTIGPGPTRPVTGRSICGQPATHRYTDGQYTWLACAGHAQAAWEVLEAGEGTLETLEEER
jgi:hypothetical protein